MILRGRNKVVVKMYSYSLNHRIDYERVFWVDDYLLYCIRQIPPLRFVSFIRDGFPDSRKSTSFYRSMLYLLKCNWIIYDVIC